MNIHPAPTMAVHYTRRIIKSILELLRGLMGFRRRCKTRREIAIASHTKLRYNTTVRRAGGEISFSKSRECESNKNTRQTTRRGVKNRFFGKAAQRGWKRPGGIRRNVIPYPSELSLSPSFHPSKTRPRSLSRERASKADVYFRPS